MLSRRFLCSACKCNRTSLCDTDVGLSPQPRQGSKTGSCLWRLHVWAWECPPQTSGSKKKSDNCPVKGCCPQWVFGRVFHAPAGQPCGKSVVEVGSRVLPGEVFLAWCVQHGDSFGVHGRLRGSLQSCAAARAFAHSLLGLHGNLGADGAAPPTCSGTCVGLPPPSDGAFFFFFVSRDFPALVMAAGLSQLFRRKKRRRLSQWHAS